MTGAVRLTQLDGKLPNLALMKLARYHRDRGDDIHFTRSPYRGNSTRSRPEDPESRGMFEPIYDRVYGSAIFSFSADRVARFRQEFPGAIVGGTWDVLNPVTIEDLIGDVGEVYDYSIYPDFVASIGFTARGCRLKCGFCVVPKKEGKPRSVNTIPEIWRGPGKLSIPDKDRNARHKRDEQGKLKYISIQLPKHLHLLDNDFFGQPRDQWEARLGEIRDGGFKVCFNQGINIRMVDADSAAALASIQYYDDQFTTRRLYTAWDNIGDEKRFFDGVHTLAKHGVPPHHLMAYMLVGYDKRETWERVLYRFSKMVALGIRPYPMIYGDKHRKLPLGGCNLRIGDRTLGDFQRWVIRKAYTIKTFDEYDKHTKGRTDKEQISLTLV